MAACSFLTLLADDRGRVALDIDALVRVAGLPGSGTEVYIIPAVGRVEHFTEGYSQFTRELELQTTYLLSFEREGCLNKQVYIDTHVPQAFMSLSPFAFRFKVTLREQERQGDRYAGPVAYVRFNAGLSMFDYETDYRMLRDSTVFERLELAHLLGTDDPALDLPASLVPVGGMPAPGPSADVASDEVSGAGSGAPRHVTRLGVDRAAPEVVPMPIPIPIPPDHVEELPQSSAPLPDPVRDGVAPRSGAGPPKATEPSAPPVDPLSWARSEELIVERLRVTTVVRVVLNGVSTEFRRVAHYHGGVTHFMNGSPCSEAVYREGTGY